MKGVEKVFIMEEVGETNNKSSLTNHLGYSVITSCTTAVHLTTRKLQLQYLHRLMGVMFLHQQTYAAGVLTNSRSHKTLNPSQYNHTKKAVLNHQSLKSSFCTEL